ncbi:HU family DNA-binding protein [Prevotella sp.]|uniref:HU family DNA-binding protein n=1 Tax=Prevotella sp. TaxID=59823 RepID=UPI002F95F9FB
MIKTNDLVQDLVKVHKLTKEEAERFVNLLFELIDEGLSNDRLVKVKGLGTFKVTSVSARESIDVNTGERIVIDGRDKISFSPDAVLRDYVNRPFAQFETVIINEGVDVEQLLNVENTASEESNEMDEIRSNGLQEESNEAVALEKAEENTFIEEETSLNDIHPELTEEPAEECQNVTDEVVNAIDSTLDSNIIHDVQSEESASKELDSVELVEEKSEESATVAMFAPVSHHQKDELAEEKSDDKAKVQHSLKRVVTWLSILCVLLLFMCGGLFYYTLKVIDQRNRQIDDLIVKINKVHNNSSHKAISKPTAKVEEEQQARASVPENSTPAAETKQVVEENVQQPSLPKEKIQQPAEKKIDSEHSENTDYSSLNRKDVRVRTGAYRIVGVKSVVKVKKGQTLQSISRLYLGPDMECYVEVLNGKKTVTAGEMLKIPALKLKKRRS